MLCCDVILTGLMLVDPSAGPPDTSPTVVGEYTGTLYWYWSDREGSGRTDYIGQVAFGDYNCYVSASTTTTSVGWLLNTRLGKHSYTAIEARSNC